MYETTTEDGENSMVLEMTDGREIVVLTGEDVS